VKAKPRVQFKFSKEVFSMEKPAAHFVLTRLLCAGLFCFLLACTPGENASDSTESPPDMQGETIDALADIAVPQDAIPDTADINSTKPDKEDPVPDVGDDGAAQPKGKVHIQVYAPGTCGCEEPIPEGPQSECGWLASKTALLFVEAEFVPDPGSPQLGIAAVELRYMDLETGEKTLLYTAYSPSEEGLYELQFDAEQAPLDLEPFLDEPGTVTLAVKAISDEPGPGLEPFFIFKVITLELDLIPPEIEVLAPVPDDDISIPYVGKLPFSIKAHDVGSGLQRFKFIIDGKVIFDKDISAFYTEGDVFSGEVDLSLADNSNSGMTVIGVDCVGNEGEGFVQVTVVAKPKYTVPTKISCDDSEEKQEVLDKIRVGEGDADGLYADFIAVHEGAVMVSWGDGEGHFAPLITVVPLLGKTQDALFVEMTGDDNPDIVALHSGETLVGSVVALYRQNTGPNGKGLRSFKLVEEHGVGDSPFMMETADLNGDGYSDVLVAHDKEGESVALSIHTGKSEQENSDLDEYLGDASFLTGAGDIRFMAIGDVDGNGLPDIVAARGKLGIISTYLNIDDALYPMAHDTLLLGTDVPLIQLGEYNNDGKLDVVAYTKDLKSAYEMHGFANGYFDPVSLEGLEWEEFGLAYVFPILGCSADEYLVPKAGKVISLGKGVNSSVAADFNVDGNLDIAMADADKGLVQLFYGLGDGSFAEAYFLNAGGEDPKSIVAGSFNSDAVPDMATTGKAACEITLFLSNDVGCFGQPGGTAPELETSEPAESPTPGIPRWSTAAEIPMPVQPKCWKKGRSEPQRIAARDFDGDGSVDIVVPLPHMQQYLCDSCTGATVLGKVRRPLITLTGVGKPGMDMTMLKSPGPGDFSKTIVALAPGNFGGKSHLDLLMGVNELALGNNTLANFAILYGGRNLQEITSCSNDPEDEACEECCIYDDTYAPGLFWEGYGPAKSIAKLSTGTVAKLDGDKLHDLVMANQAYGTPGSPKYVPDNIRVLLTRNQNGTITFEEGDFVQAPKTGEHPIAVATGYLDEDSVRDIVVANKGSHDLTLIRGTGGPDSYLIDTPEKPLKLLSVGSEPADIDVGDIDGDNMADIACVLKHKVSVSWGIDGVNFAVPLYIEKVPGGLTFMPSRVKVEDVNLDGRDDLIILSQERDELYFYISLGDRHLVGPFVFQTANSPIDMVISDINKDGCRDLLVANEGARTVTLLINQYCDLFPED